MQTSTVKLLPSTNFFLLLSSTGFDAGIGGSTLEGCEVEYLFGVEGAMVVYQSVSKMFETSTRNYLTSTKSDHHRDFHPMIVFVWLMLDSFCSYSVAKFQAFDVRFWIVPKRIQQIELLGTRIRTLITKFKIWQYISFNCREYSNYREGSLFLIILTARGHFGELYVEGLLNTIRNLYTTSAVC